MDRLEADYQWELVFLFSFMLYDKRFLLPIMSTDGTGVPGWPPKAARHIQKVPESIPANR